MIDFATDIIVSFRFFAGFTGVGMGREDEGWHFYFQALDGQWGFLHPLNLRCLKAHFGASALPHADRALASAFVNARECGVDAGWCLVQAPMRPFPPSSAPR